MLYRHPNAKKSGVSTRINEKIQEVNAEIKGVCEGSSVSYIDVYSSLSDSRGELKTRSPYILGEYYNA